MERTNDTHGSTINEERKCDMTNGDKIRAMTDEELTGLMAKHVHCGECWLADTCLSRNCYDSFAKWLRSPAEESEK